MAQLSRPYQIALAALVLAVVMWFIAFGRHSRSTGGPSPSAPAQSALSGSAASSGGAGSGSGAASRHIYHGSAPGVEGLSKDIAKAHGAVETSESYNKHLEGKSANSTGESAGSSTAPANAPGHKAHKPAAHAPAAATHAHAHAPAARAHARTHVPARHHAAAAPATKPHTTRTSPTTGVPSGQRAVEGTLTHGKVALLLFWNPNGADDAAVHGQVRTVRHSHLPVVVYEGHANDVASFGAITRQVPVYGTPTILIIGVKGRTTSLTGLQDAFAIEQAIDEARSPSP